MRCGGWILAGVMGLSAGMGAAAQEVVHEDEAALRAQATYRAEPVYPPIAKAAQVQGAVKLEIKVSRAGTVDWVKMVSGPAMLQQAAMDSVRQWRFKPFVKDGSVVEAQGTVTVEFTLDTGPVSAEEKKLAEKYFPEADQCEKAVLAQADLATAVTLCVQAADDAARFPDDRRFIEKRSAFVWAAWALLYQGNYAPALGWARQAVNVVKLGHDDNSGANAAYSVMALAEAKNGNLMEADADFTAAEDFERKAIAWGESVKFEHLESYKRSLGHDLRLHAQVLKAMSRLDLAQQKMDEAAKYE